MHKVGDTSKGSNTGPLYFWRRKNVSETISMNIFDKEEIYPNCTVQVLTNTVTGEVSIGWWKNEEDEDEEDNQH